MKTYTTVIVEEHQREPGRLRGDENLNLVSYIQYQAASKEVLENLQKINSTQMYIGRIVTYSDHGIMKIAKKVEIVCDLKKKIDFLESLTSLHAIKQLSNVERIKRSNQNERMQIYQDTLIDTKNGGTKYISIHINILLNTELGRQAAKALKIDL